MENTTWINFVLRQSSTIVSSDICVSTVYQQSQS